MTELTDVLKREHEAVETCHIFSTAFDDPKNEKVKSHCHYTGLYRDAAHNNCHLKYKIADYVLIIFHNLSGYYVYLFIRQPG